MLRVKKDGERWTIEKRYCFFWWVPMPGMWYEDLLYACLRLKQISPQKQLIVVMDVE